MTGKSDLPDYGTGKLPSVSVIITSYNKENFIEKAIRSVLEQRYKNFQCIIVDDASTDATVDRIRQCLASINDDRFQLIERKDNGGQMAAMLTGIDNCKDAFVAFVDDDDMWLPDFLECHLQAHLSKHGLAAISCSDMIIVDEEDTVLAGGFPPFYKNHMRGEKTLHADLAVPGYAETELTFVEAGHEAWIWSATSGMMFRRQLINLMRPENPENVKICADDYWARAAHMLGGTVRINRPLTCYRIHANNGWASSTFVGGLLQLGAADKTVSDAIDLEVAAKICSISDEVSAYDPYARLATSVIEMLGHARAFRLCAKNKQAYDLLWEHLPKITTQPRLEIEN